MARKFLMECQCCLAAFVIEVTTEPPEDEFPIMPDPEEVGDVPRGYCPVCSSAEAVHELAQPEVIPDNPVLQTYHHHTHADES